MTDEMKESLLDGAAAMLEADMLERELARLRAENALLREALRDGYNVLDALVSHAPIAHGQDEAALDKMKTALDGGAEFTAENQPIPDDILSGYTAEEKAQFANDWRAEMRDEAE